MPATPNLPSHYQLGALPERPLVSIVIPSYNQGQFIKQTIDSILNQSYRPIEIVVVDGESTDETVEVLQSYSHCPEVRWISEPDDGVVDAVNKGFQRATGDVLAIQSSDDFYQEQTFECVVRTFQGDSQLGLVYGDTIKVNETGEELTRYVAGSFDLESLFLLKTWISQPAAFFRRDILQRVGGWDPRIPYTPDTDLWIRMAFRTKVLKLNTFLAVQRMHEAQRDQHARKIIRDYTRMIEQSQDLRNAPAQLRRAAHAGKYLLRVRYNPSASTLYSAWNLLCAGVNFPRCFDPKRFWLTTGYYPAHRILSQAKRLYRKLLPET